MLGDRKQLESWSPALCLEGNTAWSTLGWGCACTGGQPAVLGGSRPLTDSLLTAFPFQAFKTRGSFTRSVQGGRRSHSGSRGCEGDASPCSHSAQGMGCKALWNCHEAPCSVQQVLVSVSHYGSPLDQMYESPAQSINNTRSHSIYLPFKRFTSPNKWPNWAENPTWDQLSNPSLQLICAFGIIFIHLAFLFVALALCF